LLGPLVLTRGDKSVVIRASKAGLVLALLLARDQERVSVDDLVDELWGDHPPRSALTTLQTHVYHLRRMLANELDVPHPEQMLVTSPPGYFFATDGLELDVAKFSRLVEQGREFLHVGAYEQAHTTLVQAEALWQGPAFAGIPTGTALQGHVAYLHELRLGAVELCIRAQRRMSRHAQLIPQLRSLVAQHPLHEGFHAQLIDALSSCGRRAEALAAYRSLWRILDTELGVEPAPDVQRLHQQVLAGGHGCLTDAPAS